MLTFWLQLFTVALWLVWFALYWDGGARTAADILNSARAGASRFDTMLMIGIALLSPALPLTGLAATIGVLSVESSWWATLAGALLALLGMAGTFYCRRYLGRFWTAELKLQDSHRIVDSGPYGIVRHPIYTAVSAMCVGTAIVFPQWWCWLACALVIVAYALKTRIEDDYLTAHLSGYHDYRRRVRFRLLPGVW